jgi:D-glutamate N-acetyltransferase
MRPAAAGHKNADGGERQQAGGEGFGHRRSLFFAGTVPALRPSVDCAGAKGFRGAALFPKIRRLRGIVARIDAVTLRTPYLLFIGDAADQLAAKTAAGIAFWRPEIALGQMRLPGCRADLGIPDMTIEEAAGAGVRTVIVGTTNRGGVLGAGWEGLLVRALELGMDLASGLHHRLADIPALREAARRCGRQIADVRHPTREFAVGNGMKRPGKRLLTVGTDCSIGKMFTALALEKEMRRRGLKADFRATGQTGIFIAGDGVSIDAVISDFVSGAVEWLCPAADPDHWDVIEGQGSLFHASYAGVTLALIHGAQPDALVMCHEPTRPHMRGLPHYKLPDLRLCIARNVEAAQLTNPLARCIGVSVNTSALDQGAARDYLHRTEDELGLPCIDPVRTGVAAIADRLAR